MHVLKNGYVYLFRATPYKLSFVLHIDSIAIGDDTNSCWHMSILRGISWLYDQAVTIAISY